MNPVQKVEAILSRFPKSEWENEVVDIGMEIVETLYPELQPDSGIRDDLTTYAGDTLLMLAEALGGQHTISLHTVAQEIISVLECQYAKRKSHE